MPDSGSRKPGFESSTYDGAVDGVVDGDNKPLQLYLAINCDLLFLH